MILAFTGRKCSAMLRGVILSLKNLVFIRQAIGSKDNYKNPTVKQLNYVPDLFGNFDQLNWQ